MKLFISLLFLTSLLQAAFFTSEPDKGSKQVIEQYRAISSIGNSISKRGQYAEFRMFKNSLASLHSDINELDIDGDSKQSIKNDIEKYSKIIEALYLFMDTNSPEINQHYTEALNGLLEFNQLIRSTGYAPLLQPWNELTKTKHRYLKKPSKKLAKKFYEHLSEVRLVLDDLCLDEELEEPMLAYLEIYEQYFSELDSSYKSIEYANVKKLKQLSYQVKSQLTLIIN